MRRLCVVIANKKALTLGKIVRTSGVYPYPQAQVHPDLPPVLALGLL